MMKQTVSRTIYTSRPVCWAPGMQGEEDWKDFAAGRKEIERSAKAPALEFTTALFRRRLSQLSRMTVQVVHDAVKKFNCKDLPILFTSVYGEINREFTIDRSVIEEGSVMPAAFSLSTFNAPVALATLALSAASDTQCKMTRGYDAVFPSGGNFSYSAQAAVASVFTEKKGQLLFVYGDECFPKEYDSIEKVREGKIPVKNIPLAFAILVSSARPEDYPSTAFSQEAFCSKSSPLDFLKMILKEAG